MAGRQPSYESIEAAIFFGSVAKEIERNQDLVEAMESAALLMDRNQFPEDARLMLDLGYRNVMFAKLEDRKALEKFHKRAELIGSDPQHLTWLSHYISKVDAEMEKICSDAKSIIDDHLRPSATSPEDHLFYHKLLGDLYKSCCFIKSGDGWRDAASASLKEFNRAEEIAGKLPGNSPLRLKVAVSFSILCSKILDDTKRARDIIKTALEAALSCPGELNDACKESVEKLQAMRDQDPAA